MNIIELAKKTTINLMNTASASRRVRAADVANEMNTILEGDERITSDVVKAFVAAGLLNNKGILEFKLTKGRYGGIREIDIEEKASSVKRLETLKKRQAAAANAREVRARKGKPAETQVSNKPKLTGDELYLKRVANAEIARKARAAQIASRRESVAIQPKTGV